MPMPDSPQFEGSDRPNVGGYSEEDMQPRYREQKQDKVGAMLQNQIALNDRSIMYNMMSGANQGQFFMPSQKTMNAQMISGLMG
jgi:hypothetical protein